MQAGPGPFHGGSYCQGSPQVSIKLQMIPWKAKRRGQSGREGEYCRHRENGSQDNREWKGSWRSCSDRKKSNTSQLLGSKFHSSPKCLICKQCWAQACVGRQRKKRGREQDREPNDRLIAITCARQRPLSHPAFQWKIRLVGKIRQEKRIKRLKTV